MPQKPKGGKRQKRQQPTNLDFARELILKEEGEDYGLVLKELGNRMLRVYCIGKNENRIRRCHIPKKIRERIKVGNVVLVVKREFATSDDEADIYHKYHDDEIKQLQEFKHIPEDIDSIVEAEMQKFGESYKKFKEEDAKIGNDDEEDNYANEQKGADVEDEIDNV